MVCWDPAYTKFGIYDIILPVPCDVVYAEYYCISTCTYIQSNTVAILTSFPSNIIWLKINNRSRHMRSNNKQQHGLTVKPRFTNRLKKNGLGRKMGPILWSHRKGKRFHLGFVLKKTQMERALKPASQKWNSDGTLRFDLASVFGLVGTPEGFVPVFGPKKSFRFQCVRGNAKWT